MADDPMIRIVILYPAAASDAAKLERLARYLAWQPPSVTRVWPVM